MENMRFKVDDRVRIKGIDWYNENKDEFDIVSCKGGAFVNSMTLYCDSILTIIDKTDNCYWVKENAFSWTDEMIEGLVEEETCTGLNIYKDGYIHGGNVVGNEITLPEGYQFVDEKGNVINATKIVLEKKKKEYPKSYKESCEVLGIPKDSMVVTYCREKVDYEVSLSRKLRNMQKLLICRDAYWKLYGEEMELGKPWEPDWSNLECDKFCIWVDVGDITLRDVFRCQHILAFPTAEMRDAFYENFKELIEQCKELL